MSDTVLSRRLTQPQLSSSPAMTPLQTQVDGLVTNFVHEATNTNTLASIAAGSMAYRFTRLGVMALGARSTGFLGTLIRPLSIGIGLSGEVMAFEGTGRTLSTLSGDRTNPNAWRWSGQGGWGQGIASSLVTFGMLKGAGQLSRETNLIFQHSFSATAMVAGHNTAAAFGFMSRPEGSLAEQLMHAEATNIQLGAGGSLVHSMAPGVHAFERGLDLSLQAAESGRAARPNQGLFLGQLAMATAGEGQHPSSAESLSELVNRPMQMTMIDPTDPSGSGSSSGIGGSARTPSPEITTFAPRVVEHFDEARGALETYRDTSNSSDAAEIARMSEALRVLRENPEAAREALIGRDDLDPAQLDMLSNLLMPAEFRVRVNPNITRTLIPNRGEIALRIARALKTEGITPVGLVTESEVNSSWAQQFRELGGEFKVISGSSVADSFQRAYLNIDLILENAQELKVDSVHPGYGYRSESPEFAKRLHEANLVLMGPSVESMRRSGDKDVAKQAFIEAGVPVVPGTRRGYSDVEGLIAELRDLGMIRGEELVKPIRLKAIAGGGGRGQKTVTSLTELRDYFPRLTMEAERAFGNGSIMAELFIPRFNHVEFQIMADRFGNVIHLGERECSLQEKDQKLIEIHPADIFRRFPGLRERMAEAAVRAARAMNYTGHGTVEFMVDPVTGEFYAMEVNARIQVEHRVTEAVSGFDLIREAIRVSRGLPLSARQSDIRLTGAAVELRIKAVNPDKRDKEGNAIPAPGPIDEFRVLGTDDFASLAPQGIFVETTVRAGDTVSPFADPMIAKIIVTGENREDALRRAAHVLENTRLSGSKGFASDLSRQLRLLRTQAVMEGRYDNRYVSQWVALGGENLTSFTHTRTSLLTEGTPSPIHLEVGSYERLADDAVPNTEAALQRLLTGREGDESFRLTGPVAELIRTQSNLRESILSPTGENQRRIWIQTDARGELRRLVVFENNRPQRIMISRPVRNPRMGDQKIPSAYDIQFDSTSQKLQGVTLSRQDGSGLHQIRALRADDAYIQKAESGQEYEIFSAKGARTPETLHIKLVPTRSLTALDIRDREGNLLLALSPESVMHNPAQRLLALFELQGQKIPAALRDQTETQIRELVRHLSELPSKDPIRRRAIEQLGTTPVTMIARLLHMMAEDRPIAERAVLGEIMAYREIVGFARETHQVVRELLEYKFLEPILTPRREDPSEELDPPTSMAYFSETRENGDVIPRLMIRSRAASPMNYLKTLEEAVAQLRRLHAQHPETRDNAIQIVVERSPEMGDDKTFVEFMQGSLRAALGNSYEDLNLKRVTFVVDRNLEYPDYFTFRRKLDADRKRTGLIVEDTRFRNVHPMLGHLIELRRLNNFEVERDLAHSNRMIHLYYGRNLATSELKAGEDTRLFGNALVTEASPGRGHQGELREIPEVENAFLYLARSMHASLEAWRGREAEAAKAEGREPNALPNWNRMFLNITSILDVKDSEATAFAEQLAIRHHELLAGLGLEKVVVKARIRDARIPDGYRTVLIRINNPTGYHYEPVIHNIVRASVRDKKGLVANREVLIENGTFEAWLNDPQRAIEPNQWFPADIAIRPASPSEIRERQARAKGATWAYHMPRLIGQRAEEFRIHYGLQQPREPGDSTIPPSVRAHFTELDLDPQSTVVDPRTGSLDYNQGELIPAVDKEGQPRPAGQNQAGVVIGIRTDDLGIGMPVRRVVIMGDLTYSRKNRVEGETITEGMGSLSALECTRINAAIRYAQQEGIPIDWFPASSGAEIHPERGVDGLDATASVVREIVHRAGRAGVPINIVVDDVNIGAQSYWNSLATIIHNAGGALIMTERGTMGLTGHVALTAAAQRNAYGNTLRRSAKEIFPFREHSLSSFARIHGPNGEAMGYAEKLGGAIDLLLLHHYYTYKRPGALVASRPLGSSDPATRDITLEKVLPGRTIGDEIQAVATGKGNTLAILNALRDQGSPEPQVWWTNVRNIVSVPAGNVLEGLRSSGSPAAMKWLKTTENNPAFEPLRGLPSQDEPTVTVADIQIGGRPTRVIFHQGQLSALDSDLFARAIRKADSRMPVLIMGSLPGFNAFPLAMRQQQLRNGAEIAAAISHHEGPITIVDLGLLLGGAYVVFSKQVRPLDHQALHRMIAVETARAQVLGGAASSKVVFSSRIVRRADRLMATAQRESKASAGRNPTNEALLTALRDRVLTGVQARAQELRGFLEAALKKSNTPDDIRGQKLNNLDTSMRTIAEAFRTKIEKTDNLQGIRDEVILALMELDGAKFDAHHSVHRAVEVGSFDEVVPPSRLRETIIRNQEESIGIYEERRTQPTTATVPGGAQTGLIGVLQAMGIPYEIVGQDIRVGTGHLVRLLTSGIVPKGGRRGD